MTLCLGGAGHANGCALAGGDPSLHVAGVSVFIREDGVIFWANDSISLPYVVSDDEALLIHEALARVFIPHELRRLNRIGEVPVD